MRSNLERTCVEILETGRSSMLEDPVLGHASTVESISKLLDATPVKGLSTKEVVGKVRRRNSERRIEEIWSHGKGEAPTK